jgi:hypothetical protein
MGRRVSCSVFRVPCFVNIISRLSRVSRNTEHVTRPPRVSHYCIALANVLAFRMAGFFKRNISFQGRIARGITGSILLIIGIILADDTLWAAIPLVVIGLFCMFEAVRGWCFLRACGVRTKL